MKRQTVALLVAIALTAAACSGVSRLPADGDDVTDDSVTRLTAVLPPSPSADGAGTDTVVAITNERLRAFATCDAKSDDVVVATASPDTAFQGISVWLRGPAKSVAAALATARTPDEYRYWFELQTWIGATPTGKATSPGLSDLIEVGTIPFFENVSDLPAEGDLLFGLTQIGPYEGEPPIWTAWPILLVLDHEALFVGECAEEHFAPLRAFIRERYPDQNVADVVAMMHQQDATTREFTEWLSTSLSETPVAWQERDPWERSVDPEQTPAEIIDSLDYFTIELAIEPTLVANLTDGGWGICTRSSQGWNVCVPAALFTDAQAAPDGEYPVDGFAVAGEPVELWFVPDPDSLSPDQIEDLRQGGSFFAGAIGPVGSFDVPDDTEIATRFTIVGTLIGPSTPGTLRDALEDGAITLVTNR